MNKYKDFMKKFEKQGMNQSVFSLINTLLKFPALKQQADKIDSEILNYAILNSYIELRGNEIFFTEKSSKFVRAVIKFGIEQGEL